MKQQAFTKKKKQTAEEELSLPCPLPTDHALLFSPLPLSFSSSLFIHLSHPGKAINS